jgi:hypothetical protein
MTGSTSDDWIYLPLSYTLTPNYTYIQQYSTIADIHTFQFTVAHALGFSVSTSRLLATALKTETIRVLLNHTLQMLLHCSIHKSSHHTFKSSQDDCSQLATHELLAAVSHRELTRKRASVSPINPWPDTRETLLPTVLQLLRHCWNAWRHCWRGHVTPPHSCGIQVFIAVDCNKRGEAIRDSSRHGEKTASPTVA